MSAIKLFVSIPYLSHCGRAWSRDFYLLILSDFLKYSLPIPCFGANLAPDWGEDADNCHQLLPSEIWEFIQNSSEELRIRQFTDVIHLAQIIEQEIPEYRQKPILPSSNIPLYKGEIFSERFKEIATETEKAILTYHRHSIALDRAIEEFAPVEIDIDPVELDLRDMPF